MKQLKIIIADDNVAVAERYKYYIENYSNFKIIGIALSSEEEKKMLKEYSPDVVITDYIRTNEGTSGLDIILDYEKNKKETKFILITGYSYTDIFLKCNRRMPSNVVDFISKPISNWENLIKALENV